MRLKIFLLISVGFILAAFALGWVFLSDENTTAVQPQSAEVVEIPKIDDAKPAQTKTAETQTPAATPSATEDESNLVKNKSGLEIDIARVKPDGAAVFAGKAAPNAKIRVFEQDVLLGETIADENGEWVVVLDRPLAPGQHLVMIGMETEDGQSELADITLAIEIDEAETEQPLVALLPQTETDMPKLLQSPEMETVAGTVAKTDDKGVNEDATMPLVAPRSIVWLDQERIPIAGMSRGGVRLLVSLDDRKFADVAIDDKAGSDSHEWQVSGTVDMAKARFEMLFNLLDEGNKSVATYRLPLVTSDLEKGLDGTDLVIVQTGDALWRIAYRRYGEGVRYVDIVRQNAAAINDPDLIFPNQVFAVPK